MGGQLRSVAELVQRLMHRLFAGEAVAGEFLEPFFEMIGRLVGDPCALAGFQPQEAAQQREVEFEFFFGHQGW